MRLTKEHRRAQLLEMARQLSYEGRLYDWTLNDVAANVGCSRSTVNHHFKSIIALRNAVIRDAMVRGDDAILLQARAKFDPVLGDGAAT